MWLKDAIIAVTALVVVLLGFFLARDFRKGFISTQFGTYRRTERPAQFWVWTILSFGLLTAVLCALAGALLFLPS